MSYSAFLVGFAIAVTGCASAGVGASEQADAGPGGNGRVDSGTSPIDPVDAAPPIDGPPLIDAPPSCNPVMTQLLVNGNFDMTPVGTGWIAAPINPMYPIVTADGTLIQSAPNKAWMGGLEVTPNTDSLHQDVAVPAGTTMLALTGYYQIRTGELFDFLPVDLVTVELMTTTGTRLELILDLANGDRTTQWTPISHNFTQPFAGQTVRLRMTTSSDDTDATSFFADSLALTATTCQ